MGIDPAKHSTYPTNLSTMSGDNQNVDNRIPTEEELTTLFDEAMKRAPSNSDKRMTPDEQTKFLKAMGDPEFRSLLNDYMQEISDPANRAETETYLAQLERDQKVPDDKTLIKPIPGFVVKTKWNEHHKVFVNICASEKLQPPSSTKVDTGPQVGTSWSLPYSIGPERMEPDKSGSHVITYDVCFHPRTLQFATTQKPYRDMVVKTALDAIEPLIRQVHGKPTALLAREYHVLKGVTYKSGEPVTMCLTTPGGRENGKTVKTDTTKVEAKTTERLDPQGMNADEDKTIHHKVGIAKKPLIQEVTTTPSERTDAPKSLPTLDYRVVHRGKFEMMDHMQATLHRHETSAQLPNRPRELIVEISFPNHSSAKGIDLDVNDRAVKVETTGYQSLHVTLPFAVIEEKGSAKFDKKARKLVVTLPVQPPELVPVKRMAIVEHEDEEDEDVHEETSTDRGSQEIEAKILIPAKTAEKVPKDDVFAMLRETALMVANDPMYLPRPLEEPSSKPLQTKQEATLSSENNLTLDETVKAHVADDALYNDLPPLESCSEDEDEVEMDLQDTLAMAVPPKDAVQDLAQPNDATTTNTDVRIFYKTPPYNLNETESCISYLVEVANVDSTSIKVEFPSTKSLQVRFSTTHEQFDLCVDELSTEIDTGRSEVHVATENVAIILYKTTGFATGSEINEQVAQVRAPPPIVRFQNDLLYDID